MRRFWPYHIRCLLVMPRTRFGKLVGIKPWRLLDIERGSPLRIEEVTSILKGIGEVAFHQFRPEIKLSFSNLKQEPNKYLGGNNE